MDTRLPADLGVGRRAGSGPTTSPPAWPAREITCRRADLACRFLADLGHDRLSLGGVSLGIDLGHVGPGVPQDDLRRLQAEQPADPRRRGVPELVRMPARDPGPGAG